MQAVQGHRAAAAGHAHALADLGDRSDLRVLAFVARDEQHALLVVADVDGDRDVHVREDDEVVQRYEEQRAHAITNFPFESFRQATFT